MPGFVLCRIEGEMSPVCLQYPAADGDGTSISVSVLDKLIHTHPIWLLLSIDQREATGILLQQPAGVKYVRQSERKDARQSFLKRWFTEMSILSSFIHPCFVPSALDFCEIQKEIPKFLLSRAGTDLYSFKND